MNLLEGIIGGLIVAWVLTLFGVDVIVIQFVEENFDKVVSTSTYYVGFAIIGLIGALLEK